MGMGPRRHEGGAAAWGLHDRWKGVYKVQIRAGGEEWRLGFAGGRVLLAGSAGGVGKGACLLTVWCHGSEMESDRLTGLELSVDDDFEIREALRGSARSNYHGVMF